MPKMKRFKTKYPGVIYIEAISVGSSKAERIYYIIYRKDGKLIEEKAGRQFQDDMTPAKAALIRSKKIQREQPSNKEQREAIKAQKKAEHDKWTIERLWNEYKAGKANFKGLIQDQNRFDNYLRANFGDKEPRDLFSLDIDRLRVNLLKKKSPGTVKNILELLRRIIHYGEKKNLCHGLDFIIELPTVNNTKTEDLSPGQLKCLMEVIEQEINLLAATFMKMVLFTGMRRGWKRQPKIDHL
jgi:hypothetical protein